MVKRLFDLLFSVLGLIFLSPLFILLSIIIVFDSKGGAFYFQQRVGKNNTDFNLIKFRTMRVSADEDGLLTIGGNDTRITKAGLWLRKYKLDELPQLLNIFKGEMSFVGPRPEVRKYVEMYNYGQMQVLSVKPGLTDYASLKFINESEILANYSDPEKVYVEKIMPEKLAINLQYINEQEFFSDLNILFRTIVKVFK